MSTSPLVPAVLAIILGLTSGAAQAANQQEQAQQCRAQIDRIYRETWPKGVTADGGARAKFVGHYNAKLGKCLYLETVSGTWRSPALKRILPRQMQRLADAGESKDLGKFDAWNEEPPVTCWVQDKSCASKQEWQQLISPYLNE